MSEVVTKDNLVKALDEQLHPQLNKHTIQVIFRELKAHTDALENHTILLKRLIEATELDVEGKI